MIYRDKGIFVYGYLPTKFTNNLGDIESLVTCFKHSLSLSQTVKLKYKATSRFKKKMGFIKHLILTRKFTSTYFHISFIIYRNATMIALLIMKFKNTSM